MSDKQILPQYNASGTVCLSGSKSISNRVLWLSALANAPVTFENLLDAQDTQVMKDVLQTLNLPLKLSRIYPNPSSNPITMDVKNAGTVFRPLVAVLSMLSGQYIVTGSSRLCERPIAPLVEALNQAGACIRYLDQQGYAPLLIQSGQFHTSNLYLDANLSSQFISALLMASPLLSIQRREDVWIHIQGSWTSKPYVRMTCELMKQFGVSVDYVKSSSEHQDVFCIPADSHYQAPDVFKVEPDASTASYFMALGLLGDEHVNIKGLSPNSIQGDMQFLEVIHRMGGHTVFDEEGLIVYGLSVALGHRLKAFDMDFQDMPDVAMTAAVLALYADDTCILRNIHSWQYKETDRIEAMKTELSRLGAKVWTDGQDFHVTPPVKWQSASIQTYNDHRMAMSFSLACFGGVDVTILDIECVEKTCPQYFEYFDECIKG